MKISAKIDQIFQGNLNRQIMKLPWTKKQKFPLFNQTSCQQQEQQRNSSAWPCRFAAGKKYQFSCYGLQVAIIQNQIRAFNIHLLVLKLGCYEG